jgi:hypothetical protein
MNDITKKMAAFLPSHGITNGEFSGVRRQTTTVSFKNDAGTALSVLVVNCQTGDSRSTDENWLMSHPEPNCTGFNAKVTGDLPADVMRESLPNKKL